MKDENIKLVDVTYIMSSQTITKRMYLTQTQISDRLKLIKKNPDRAYIRMYNEELQQTQ